MLFFSSWFSAAAHPGSSFDTVLSDLIPPPSLSHTTALLEEFARLLKPSGSLVLAEPVSCQGRAISSHPSLFPVPWASCSPESKMQWYGDCVSFFRHVTSERTEYSQFHLAPIENFLTCPFWNSEATPWVEGLYVNRCQVNIFIVPGRWSWWTSTSLKASFSPQALWIHWHFRGMWGKMLFHPAVATPPFYVCSVH